MSCIPPFAKWNEGKERERRRRRRKRHSWLLHHIWQSISQNDLILCGQATMQEAATMKTILQAFCDSSGQTPNFQKSYILFSRNVDNNTKIAIKNIFPVLDLQPHTKHLGHPIIFSHNDRNRAYNFIYGKFKGKLTTVRANKLNHAGRLAYIQSVLSSIPHLLYVYGPFF